MKRSQRLALAATALAVPAAASASETVTYTYDALGRLTGVSTSGGPNDGLTGGTGYDPAGNRSSYSVSGAGTEPLAPASVSPPDAPDGATGALAPAQAPPALGIPDEEEPIQPVELLEGEASPAEIPDGRH
jgi:YD repeat-containing protein